MAGIDYGTGDSNLGKFLPFNKTASAWWMPGESNWLFGGDATKAIDDKLKHGEYVGGYIQDQLGGVGQRQAPTSQAAQVGSAAQLDSGPQGQVRDQQGQVTGRLMQIMNGDRAGAGELAVNRQVGQATAAQQAAARMSRGANASLAARTAARNTADIGVAGAGQAAQAQMQDQANATGQLGSMLGQTRGQDLTLAGQNAQLMQQRDLAQAGFNQQTNLANQGAQLQQTGMNDQAQMGYLAQLLGVDKATLEAQIAKQQVALGDQGHLGSLLQAGGSMMAASDERLKVDVEDADVEVDNILQHLTPKSYRYIDEKHGKGRRVGIMAQDLERSPSARYIVVETPEGKMLDVNKALSLALAAVARLDARVRELEGR